MYRALTKVHLPYIGEPAEGEVDGPGKTFNEGEQITIADLKEARQTDEDLERLIEDGAIEEE